MSMSKKLELAQQKFKHIPDDRLRYLCVEELLGPDASRRAIEAELERQKDVPTEDLLEAKLFLYSRTKW